MTLLLLLSLAADADRPDVVFVAVDDLAATLGCYGDALARTPNIDRLANSGCCFLSAHNQIPLCNPSRASVLTGLRPDRLGVYDLDRHFRDELPRVRTLPQRLRDVGYRCVRVGKIYHYNVPAAIGTDGFDDPDSWDRTINPYGRDKRDQAEVYNPMPNRKVSAALSWLQAGGTASEQTDGLSAMAATTLIESPRKQPLFLAVGFFRPHTPYIAPRAYFDRFALEDFRLPFAPADDRDDLPVAALAHNNPVPHYGLRRDTLVQAMHAYYASVAMVDDLVGQVLDAIDRSGRRDSTIVVLWSDHGYHLGEHGGIWQKRTLFEPCTRTPLMMRVPHAQPRVCRDVVEFIDIAPTVSDLCGADPSQMDGQSLVALLRGERASGPQEAFTQILRPADARLPRAVMGRTVRTPQYRYTEWNGGEAGRELYDLRADPGEFVNLAVQPSAAAKTAIERLRSRFEGRARAMPPKGPVNPARL